MLQNILLVLAYDGTDFHGFQAQKGQRTVQGVLEETLSQFYGRPTRIIGAGRTDAGVHANGQLANYLAASDLPAQAMSYKLNPLLPDDLLVLSSRAMPLDFHARFMTKKKLYRYRLVLDKVLHPLERNFKVLCPYPVDLDRMKAAGKLFEGRHDFSSFSVLDPGRTPVRTIDRVDIQGRGREVLLQFEGASFLREQVRIMVGALVDAGRGHLTLGRVCQALEEGGDHPIAPAWPACGLTLAKVFY